MLRLFFTSLLITLVSSQAGCARGTPAIEDGEDAGRVIDAATDADVAEPHECEDAIDGDPCGESEGLICLYGECVLSRCGDGFVDEGEECDDGNSILRDGCENDCTPTCESDEDCDDGNICNGIERCASVSKGGRLCVSGPAPVCNGGASGGPGVQGRDDNPCVFHYCDPDAESLETACQLDPHDIFCYPDEDGDGFPAPYGEVPTVGMCECPSGTVRQRADQAWDCNDKNAMVRPDLEPSVYFADPYCEDGSIATRTGKGACSPALSGASCFQYECEDDSTPSFDYNCDGAEAQRDTSTGGKCTYIILVGCTGERAFEIVSALPCGAEASYALCGSGMLQLCDSEVREQECR